MAGPFIIFAQGATTWAANQSGVGVIASAVTVTDSLGIFCKRVLLAKPKLSALTAGAAFATGVTGAFTPDVVGGCYQVGLFPLTETDFVPEKALAVLDFIVPAANGAKIPGYRSKPSTFRPTPADTDLADAVAAAFTSIGGGGPAPAIDAHHLYVYDCTELPGATALVNTGHGANGDLALQGAEGTNYFLRAPMGRGAKGAAFMLPGNTSTGAWSGTTASVTAGAAIAIEMLFVSKGNGFSTVPMLIHDSVSGDNNYLYFEVNNGTVAACMNHIGTLTKTAFISIAEFGPAVHALGVLDVAAGKLKLYLDGMLMSSVSITLPALPAFNRICLGSMGPLNTALSCRGFMTQARVSDTLRDAAYALATAKTLLAM